LRHPLALALLLVPILLQAQQGTHTISPGMTKVQVVAALGEPATLRTVGDDAYLFYHNACGKQCGMNDLVVLHADTVVDAIFRSPDRHYTGKSSSPAAIAPQVAAQKKSGTAGEQSKAAPAAAAPTKRPTPTTANDIKPSIPVNPPAVRPAPTPKPASKSP
jgi:outer membrane protein assembly factor BamE (lipoprotein component of BamABCDE complex)